MNIKRHVRFRADPEKVRVSIRRMIDQKEGVYYRAQVESRLTTQWISATGDHARVAIFRALHLAKKENMSGIDLDMEWVYDHPQVAGADDA